MKWTSPSESEVVVYCCAVQQCQKFANEHLDKSEFFDVKMSPFFVQFRLIFQPEA